MTLTHLEAKSEAAREIKRVDRWTLCRRDGNVPKPHTTCVYDEHILWGFLRRGIKGMYVSGGK